MKAVLRGLRSLFSALLIGSPLINLSSAQRQPAEGESGMVASAHALASQAGLDVLKRGGNAVDAAVATALTLAVVYPRAGNLGGGGFMLIALADGRTTAIDFRETAPGRATADMYLNEAREVVPDRSTLGYLAVGTPGTVAGLALAKARYGTDKLSWSELVEPARRIAQEGFIITNALAKDLRASEALLSQFAESRRIFLRDGNPYAAGERMVQSDLAATLGRIQESWEDFYTGETARLIAEDMRTHGGLISLADLAAYRPVERETLRGHYRGLTLITMPPPSSGGIALLQMLGMIEPHDLDALGQNSAAKIHLFTEVMRRAFRDRAEFLGDPGFVPVPTQGLLAPEYLHQRMADFNPGKASPSDTLKPGSPEGAENSTTQSSSGSAPRESTETTHFSVVDAAGNVVSCTYTLNGLYGSGVTATGTGVLLNNEMDDFTAKVGVKNLYGLIQGTSNAIAPNKRPLSSMTPTIVLKEDRPLLVTGSPGGPTIINTVLLVITNIVDHHMTVTQAVDAPRFHHQWQPDVVNYEPLFTSTDTLELLRARGHTLTPLKLYPNDPEAASRTWGDAESIFIDPNTGRRLGANDLRSPDSAALGF